MTTMMNHPAPAWADEKTEVFRVEPELFDDGTVFANGFTSWTSTLDTIEDAVSLGGHDGGRSALRVAVSRTVYDDGQVSGPGVELESARDGAFCFTAATARRVAAALWQAADLVDGKENPGFAIDAGQWVEHHATGDPANA